MVRMPSAGGSGLPGALLITHAPSAEHETNDNVRSCNLRQVHDGDEEANYEFIW